MQNLITYRKYYFLENYLFNEVSNNFENNHFLTDEEFFAIVIWKSNRSKTKVLNGIKSAGQSIREITTNIYYEDNKERKVEILTKIDGIGIPVASAILSVCYPNDFIISDYRALSTLNKLLGKETLVNLSNSVPRYLEYLDLCKKVADEKGLNLRDLDVCLWGYDFYEGKNGLKELIRCV